MLLTQRRCRSFLLSKATGDVWNSNTSYPTQHTQAIITSLPSSPFINSLHPTLLYIFMHLFFIILLYNLKKKQTNTNNSIKSKWSIYVYITIQQTKMASGEVRFWDEQILFWLHYQIRPLKCLSHTYIYIYNVSNISYFRNPLSMTTLLVPVQVMTSCNSNVMSTIQSVSFLIVREIASLHAYG